MAATFTRVGGGDAAVTTAAVVLLALGVATAVLALRTRIRPGAAPVLRAGAVAVAVAGGSLLVAVVARVDGVTNPAAWRTALTERAGVAAVVATALGIVLAVVVGPAAPGGRRRWPTAMGIGLAVTGAAGVALLPAAGPTAPVEAFAASGSVQMAVSLEPGTTGPADLHLIAYDTTGTLSRFGTMTASVRPDGTARADAVAVPLEPVTPGHAVGLDVTFPTAGRWLLEVRVDRTDGTPPLVFDLTLDLPS